MFDFITFIYIHYSLKYSVISCVNKLSKAQTLKINEKIEKLNIIKAGTLKDREDVCKMTKKQEISCYTGRLGRSV